MFIKKFLLFSLIIILIGCLFSNFVMAKILTVATDPLGTGTYGATAGIAKIINSYNAMGLNIKVKPTLGATEVAGLLATGEVELGIINNFEARTAWLTEGEYEILKIYYKVLPIRTLMGGPPVFAMAVTSPDSGIKSGKDLKGKKVVVDYAGEPNDTYQALAFLANWGLTRDDVIAIKAAGLTDAMRLLIEGKVDALAGGGAGIGTAISKELESTRGIFWLDLNTAPGALELFSELLPYPHTIVLIEPGPMAPGLKEPTHFLQMEDFILANKGLVDEATAYEIVKTLWDNNDELRTLHSVLLPVDRAAMITKGLCIPFHRGAIKFYKEMGAWTEEDEARNQKLLETERENM